MPETLDPRQADLGYEGFPPFAEWANSYVDTGRWEQYAARLHDYRNQPDLFRRALRVVNRAAAVDTGAIENLYETDRGFTFTVAMELAAWESTVASKGDNVRPLLEAQFKAYDYVLDFATQKTPLTEVWIRQLHEVICEGQDYYQVVTEVGVQKHRLPKGKYKSLPNHVRTQDGRIHSYAPVDLTPDEMFRFCKELETEAFQKAHPTLQAAYAHYAFVAIHPFSDGNGRVARALASIFTLRAASVPVLILAETRPQYYEALQAADKNDIQPFVGFMFERSMDALQFVSDSFETVKHRSPDESIKELQQLYMTKSGYTHEEVDNVGFSFLRNFFNELIEQKGKIINENLVVLTTNVLHSSGDSAPYRTPMIQEGGNGFNLRAYTKSPAEASVEYSLLLRVPMNPKLDDHILIKNTHTGDEYKARIQDLIPTLSPALSVRISIMVEGLLSKILEEVTAKAQEVMRHKGFM